MFLLIIKCSDFQLVLFYKGNTIWKSSIWNLSCKVILSPGSVQSVLKVKVSVPPIRGCGVCQHCDLLENIECHWLDALCTITNVWSPKLCLSILNNKDFQQYYTSFCCNVATGENYVSYTPCNAGHNVVGRVLGGWNGPILTYLWWNIRTSHTAMLTQQMQLWSFNPLVR